MSASRICKNCSHVLPTDFSDATCPVCGASQVKLETPQQDLTAATREQHFSLGPTADVTAAHLPGTPIPTTVPGERTPVGKFHPRVPPDLPNYSEITWISHGGMGDVYRATQAGTGRTVAVKVMRAALAGFGQNRERFEKEVRALARVDHPGVVRVYEYGDSAAGPYFTMEFVSGETLAQRVKDRGPLAAADAARLVRAAAEAVHAAHAVGVLHRDLKPTNVMVADDGAVKVTDFGLAKHEDETGEFTHTGVVVGTPSYMAPEQADGGVEPAAAADVYGLGGTLYHLLTGRPPHKADTHAQLMRKVSAEPVEPPRAHRPDLCPVLDAVVQKSLARDPARRYASAGQFAEELDNWAHGRPTIAVPPTGWQRAARWAYRRRVAVAATVLLPLLIGAAVVHQQQSEAARRDADPKVQLDRDLARNEPTTLIPETGGPRWTDWLINRVEPGFDAHGSFSFQTQTLSILLLATDPLHDRYTLTAELKHRKATEAVSFVGVYVGSGDGPAAGVCRGVSFDFFDAVPYLDPNGKPPPPPELLALAGKGLFTANDRVTVRTPPDVASLPFEWAPPLQFTASNQGANNPWRKIVLDVSPDGVAAYWETRTNKAKPDLVLTRSVLAANTPPWGNRLGNFLKAPGPVWAPEWTPRGPIGILAAQATVDVRNVVLTPVSE